MNPAEFLAPPLVLGVIFFGIYSLVKIAQENKLKKALIQKGADTELIKSIFASRKKDPYPNLRFGLILVALGGALAMGEIFGNGQLTAALMLSFSGVAFLIYFVVAKNLNAASSSSQPDFLKDL